MIQIRHCLDQTVTKNETTHWIKKKRGDNISIRKNQTKTIQGMGDELVVTNYYKYF